MKTVFAIMLSCAALCCAQDSNKTASNKPEEQQEPAATENIKRLQSVTWDLATHKLVWTVEKGSVVDGEFVPAKIVKYEVSPDDAFMAYAGEKRSVAEEEAADLHHLLDVLSLYCVESVVWWDHDTNAEPAGPSAPGVLTKPEKPTQTKPASPANNKIVKVGDLRPLKMQ
jgi:hypothetical protein